MILDTAPAGVSTIRASDAARWPRAAEGGTREGRHIVVGTGERLHRIWLRSEKGLLSSILMFDAMTATRLEAISAFAKWLEGKSGPHLAGHPTRYQARRLRMLLAILDLRDAERDIRSHEVARRLIYPRLAIGRGAEWKGSSERRRTLRLIAEAEALRAGGYRSLLAGRAG